MKAAAKTQRPKRQEKHVNFINWHSALLCGRIPLVLTLLLGCVAWLRVISPDMLMKEGDMRSLHVQQVSTSRGMITDRSDRSLAVSVSVKMIWVDPKEVYDAGGISVGDRWKTLANALNIPLDQPSARIDANPKGRFVYLARQANPDMTKYIKKLKLPGIHSRKESRRYYPFGEVTVHLTGSTNVDSQRIEGVEKSSGKWPTRQPGERIMRKDRYGRVIEDISSTGSQATHNLTLSTNGHLQALIYREPNNTIAFNKAGSSSTMLAGINIGEVLAMASNPSYNPNDLSGTPKKAMRNRAITDVFEPSSTVKSMVVMTALQHGVVWENSVLNTIPYRISGHEIKDVMRYGGLTLTGVLQKSSNVGVSKLVLAMSSSALIDTYSRFGLGKVANLGLIGERSGSYPQKQRWSDMERATSSSGCGLMVVLLQLTRVHATIGSYGIYRPLSITKVGPPVSGERVFLKSIVRTTVHMMESVVLPGGGGVKAVIRDYRIATKTGATKKVGPDGYYVNKYTAYTAGVTPVSQPRFTLVVIINDPQMGKYYGGAISAPVFDTIMGGVLRTISIEPDVLTTGNESESVINQGEGTGGGS